MALANYSDLVASVASWLVDSDVNAVIPDWIALCEEDFHEKLRLQSMEVYDDTYTVSSRLTAFPTDFLEWREIRHNSSPYEKLDLVGADWANEHYNWLSTGRPRKYLNEAGQLRMVPAPDTSYTLQIVYYQKFPALSVSNPTNAMLTNNPSVYLYGTLAQSAGYLGADERIAIWTAQYEKSLSAIIKSDQRARWSGSTPSARVRYAP